MHLSKKLIVAIVAIAAIAAGTTAYPAIPDVNGVIHGCYDPKTGALRVLDTPTNGFSLSCAPKEAGLTWSQQGPKGDRGDKGDKGDKGDTGPSDGYAVLAAQPLDPVVTLAFNSTVVAKLNLPAGKYLVSAKVWLRSDDSIGSNNTRKLHLPDAHLAFPHP